MLLMPLCLSIRIGIVDKAFFKNRLDYVAKGMMHNPVSEIRLWYFPSFWVMDYKIHQGLWAVAMQKKLWAKQKQIFFDILLKIDDIRFCRLALSCFFVSEKKIVIRA